MSQCDEILEAMRRGERITALDALRRFGCLNLKGRIWDIKQKVADRIEKEWLKLPNGKTVAEYYIDFTGVDVGENFKISF